jgi:hypothetical protein
MRGMLDAYTVDVYYWQGDQIGPNFDIWEKNLAQVVLKSEQNFDTLFRRIFKTL